MHQTFCQYTLITTKISYSTMHTFKPNTTSAFDGSQKVFNASVRAANQLCVELLLHNPQEPGRT